MLRKRVADGRLTLNGLLCEYLGSVTDTPVKILKENFVLVFGHLLLEKAEGVSDLGFAHWSHLGWRGLGFFLGIV